MVKDMIFQREAANRIFNTAYSQRSDGYCKVNDNAFCTVYLDTSSVNEPKAIITTYDKITKAQTNGSAVTLNLSDKLEARAVYLEDNKICFLYCDAVTNELFARVGTVSGTSITLGTESADLLAATYYCKAIDAVALDSTHVGVIMSLEEIATMDYYIGCMVFSISGTSIDSAGNVILLRERLSPLITDSEMYISAFNSTSYGVTYLDDDVANAYTVKIEVSGVTSTMNQTPLLLVDTEFYAFPALGCYDTDKALVGWTYDSKAWSQYLATIDYSGSTPEILYQLSVPTGKNIWWRFVKVSNGSLLVVADARDTIECGLWIINIYGDEFRINYVVIDVAFANKISMGLIRINKGECVLFWDEAGGARNVDAILLAYLGGVSSPEFSSFNNIDFGLVEIGESSVFPVTFQNDGIYPEDIAIDAGAFYLNDDNGLLVHSASITVESEPILVNEDYNYLVDPKGNFLKVFI